MFEDIQIFLDSYPRGRQCSLQTFDDKGKDPKLARIFEATDDNIYKVVELNKKGAGVYFSVNTMKPGKRDKASVMHLNAYFTEIDGLPKEEQEELINNAPIYPSLVVESKNGYHIYYYAKEHKDDKNWKRIMRGLCNYYGGDSKVIDTSRVLRIPGTYHNKQEPYKVELYTGNISEFTENEMLGAFTDQRTTKDKERELKDFEGMMNDNLGGNYWERVKQMNTMKMLKKLSGHEFVSKEYFTFEKNSNGTHQIIINGKKTSNRIDKSGKPAVGLGTAGGGNRVSYVYRYGKCDGPSLSKRINQNFPEIAKKEKENKFNKKPSYIDKIKEAPAEPTFYEKDKLITWGNHGVDERFGMLHKDYCMIFGGAGEGKTVWTTNLASANGRQGKKVVFLTMELTAQQLKERYAQSSLGLTRFHAQTKHKSEDHIKNMLDKYKEFDKDFKLLGFPFPYIDELVDFIRDYTKSGYELFILDNLGKIRTKSGKNELEEQMEISGKLQALKNELGVTIILVHHKNKKGDMRGSQKLKDDVTLMINLSRDYIDNVTLLELEKLTDGSVDDYEARLTFDKGIFHDYKI